MKHLTAGLALAFATLGGAACHASKATTANPPAPGPPMLQAATSATATADGATCDAVADHMRDEMIRVAAVAKTDIARLIPVFRRVVLERCTGDAWSADARTCLSTAVGDDLNACEGKLTTEQNAALGQAFDAAVSEELVKPDGARSKSMAAPPPPPDDPCSGKE